jgi:hypothetical protein
MVINGVERTTSIHQKSGVTIELERSERARASFVCIPGYIPNLREEVQIFDQDGTTKIFGGVIYTKKSRGKGLLTFTEVECVDFSIYASWLTASYTFTGTVTLLSVMQLLVNNWLYQYGITLSGSQVTGSSINAAGYTWTYKTIDQCLRDVSTYLGNGTWTINPDKVIEMVLKVNAPAAPFSLTDANSNCQDCEWEEDISEYATKIILLCGGTGTKDVSQTWVISAGDIANGYVETDAPSIPTGGVSATVNGSPKTIGPSGSELIWDWSTHRVYAGTYTPTLGQTLVLNYTAQYPFIVTADAGISPPIELVINADDLTSKITAQATANGLLARYYQQPRKFNIQTTTAGLKPGQLITINLTNRSTGNVSAFITKVTIQLISDSFWRYTAEAQTGEFQTNGMDYFRTIGGQQPVAGYTGGANPAILLTVLPPTFLGGSRNESVAPSPAAYTPAPNFVLFRAPTTFSGLIRVDLWARRAGISCTARLYDVTASASAGNSSPITSQTATSTTFSASIVVGHVYRLELLPSSAGEGVYGIGTIESQ